MPPQQACKSKRHGEIQDDIATNCHNCVFAQIRTAATARNSELLRNCRSTDCQSKGKSRGAPRCKRMSKKTSSGPTVVTVCLRKSELTLLHATTRYYIARPGAKGSTQVHHMDPVQLLTLTSINVAAVRYKICFTAVRYNIDA